MSGKSTCESSRRRRALALLVGAAAVHVGGAPASLAAQIQTVDLSESPVETVIPSEYDGGFFASIGDIVVNELGIWVVDPGHKHVVWFNGPRPSSRWIRSWRSTIRARGGRSVSDWMEATRKRRECGTSWTRMGGKSP